MTAVKSQCATHLLDENTLTHNSLFRDHFGPSLRCPITHSDTCRYLYMSGAKYLGNILQIIHGIRSVVCTARTHRPSLRAKHIKWRSWDDAAFWGSFGHRVRDCTSSLVRCSRQVAVGGTPVALLLVNTGTILDIGFIIIMRTKLIVNAWKIINWKPFFGLILLWLSS